MAEHFPINFDKLYGGMTPEYFAFFCPKCHREMNQKSWAGCAAPPNF
jgi:hypothetical protein